MGKNRKMSTKTLPWNMKRNAAAIYMHSTGLINGRSFPFATEIGDG